MNIIIKKLSFELLIYFLFKKIKEFVKNEQILL